MGARIERVEERGFVLRVAGASLRVQEAPGVRFWRDRTPSGRDAFARGDEVVVRLNAKGRVATLREMADRASADWLAARRGGVSRGRVVAANPERLTLDLGAGEPFAFALTRGTLLPSGGLPKAGEIAWVRGQGSERSDAAAAEVSLTPLLPRKVTVRGEERIAEGVVRLVSPQADEIVLTLTAPIDVLEGAAPKGNVADASGDALTLPITASTPMWDEGRRLARAALVPGVRLRAVWTVGATGKARVRRIEALEFP